MKINNKFKDSMFTMLFAAPDLLRELYCALEGVILPQDAPVSINTLENVLFMEFNNDISFEIDGKLVVLIEHQSTINPNMALRLLMYIGRVYEKIVEGRNIYSSKRLSVPRPEFFVLYNGTDPYPDERIIKLSDAFEKAEFLELAGKDSPALELSVRVLNINEGRNSAIAGKCKKLAEYSAFVAKVRAFYHELGSREEAVKSAIKYCRKHGILKEFLELHAAEVLSMLMTEWNTEDAIAVAREEGKEEGMEREQEIIAKNALESGLSPDFVQKITGLDMDAIKNIQTQ
jgi:hypothetical protein